MKFDGLIEYIDSLTDRLCVEKYSDFYLCYNMFTEDKNSKSASIWRDDGTLQMHNSTGEDGKTRYSISEWISELGMVDIFVKWICKREDIDVKKMEFYDYVIKKDFQKMGRNERNACMEFKKIFCKKYFLKVSVVANRKHVTKFITSQSFIPKQKSKATSVLIDKPLDIHLNSILDYMDYRGLEESDICYPVTVHINGFIKKGGVCFEYPNGFRKVRYVGFKKDGKYVDANKKFKFLANSENGRYEELYCIKFGDTTTAIVCEGETEGFMLSKYMNCDIYTSHNAVAMADKSKVLEKYERVIVFLDLDRYEEIKAGVKKSISNTALKAHITVLPKFPKSLQDKICKHYEIANTDFNDLYIRNESKLKEILQLYKNKFDIL